MERTLFSFIWKYSKRDQFVLLALTIITFPFLYATLELPKQIINDAIGSELPTVTLFGMEMPQIQFLLLLCFGYLGAVLAHGLLKMRLNTLKGITAERMLRRFRFQLLTRMTRFPKPYFRTTSQGELVSMVTAEAEPMGGLMGDAIAQPVFQAGQMLIIGFFLFLQSVWFGLAAIALIPLQAWIIPILQRQINLLNKERIQEIRGLSSEIGETAAGIADLRVNGGLRFRSSQFSYRLGRLFDVRFRIFQKKFFMKFLNNFITQLTPFFFYSVGGVLAIRGEITVGALVAALAAYKDLSSPWKELLTYYNQVQDMSLRWDIVTEKFDPRGVPDEDLFENPPSEFPRLTGDIVLDKAGVRTADGTYILQGLDLTIPGGSMVGVKVKNQMERTALADLLTREVEAARGSVSIGGTDMSTIHQSVIGARVGYAPSQPNLFQGTFASNLIMPLMTEPRDDGDASRSMSKRKVIESERSGNSTDPVHANWLHPELAQLSSADEVRQWWFDLVRAMGIDDFIFRRMLRSLMDVDKHETLAREIVAIREEVAARLTEAGLDDMVHRFDPDKFNPSIPLGGNLLFASPRRMISQEEIVSNGGFLGIIVEVGLTGQVIGISQTLISTLDRTFGRDGTSHPLFTALNIDEELYERLVSIARRRQEKGDSAITEEEFSLLLTVPFAFTAEQIGPAFPESFKDEILNIRRELGAQLRAQVGDLFVPVEPQNYLPRLTILENALYGRVSMLAGTEAEQIEDIVAEILAKRDLRRLVAEVIFDTETSVGGSNLPAIFQERIAVSRAAIKKPDVLIFDKALPSHTQEERRATRARLRALLPDTTLIFLESGIKETSAFDQVIEIKNGMIEGVQVQEREDLAEEGSDDLRKKMGVLAETELFSQLDTRNQRLLAFAANWYKAPAGKAIFNQGERADAAYLCVSGQAVLSFDDDDTNERFNVSTVDPGRLIGDMSIITGEERKLNLNAVTDTVFLRISAEEFLAVVESDPGVLISLLRTVSGYLTNAADLLREAKVPIPQPENLIETADD